VAAIFCLNAPFNPPPLTTISFPTLTHPLSRGSSEPSLFFYIRTGFSPHFPDRNDETFSSDRSFFFPPPPTFALRSLREFLLPELKRQHYAFTRISLFVFPSSSYSFLSGKLPIFYAFTPLPLSLMVISSNTLIFLYETHPTPHSYPC